MTETFSFNGNLTRLKDWFRSHLRLLAWIAKIAVLIVSGRYLYVQVIQNARFDDILTLTMHVLANPISVWLFISCLVLGVANWGIETLKWQFLIKKFSPLGFWRAFAAVIAGNAISLWTPNRIGEYVGRVVFVKPEARVKSILATLAGSISQLVVTLVMGAVGLVCYEKLTGVPNLIQWAISVAGLLFIGLLLFFYFNIGRVRSWFPAKKWTIQIRKSLMLYRHYKSRELELVLLYSLLRYAVFCMQFYMLLLFFGVHTPFLTALMLIFVMYMVQTVSPTSGFSELVVRGSATVFLFHNFATSATAVLSASYGIWVINLLIPSVVGAVLFGFARVSQRSKVA